MATRSGSKKVAARPRPEPTADGDLEVIVKVTKPNYVLNGVTVRAQISPMLFTSVIPARTLKNFEDDPQVQSVSIIETLRTNS